MKRTPEEWLQFAQDNERQDDPVNGHPSAGVAMTYQAFAYLCEAVRAEALTDAAALVDAESEGYCVRLIERLRDKENMRILRERIRQLQRDEEQSLATSKRP